MIYIALWQLYRKKHDKIHSMFVEQIVNLQFIRCLIEFINDLTPYNLCQRNISNYLTQPFKDQRHLEIIKAGDLNIKKTLQL